MRFYTKASNSRGKTVGVGGHKSGQDVHVSGWDLGVKVYSSVVNEKDVFELFMSYGSNAKGNDIHIGTVELIDGKPTLKRR